MIEKGKIILRFGLLLFFVALLSVFFIQKARIDPIPFSLREGEISCETTEECLKKVKDNVSIEATSQLQVRKDEFKRATSFLVSFALIPIEYKVDFENFSHLKVWITGTNQSEHVTDLAVTCNFGGTSRNLKYKERLTIYKNLKLDTFREEILDRFDGCVPSPGFTTIEGVKGWVWPPGEFIKMSFERDFYFILQLSWISILLIFFQSFVVTLLVLPILKQGGLYVKKGIKYFFDE